MFLSTLAYFILTEQSPSREEKHDTSFFQNTRHFCQPSQASEKGTCQQNGPCYCCCENGPTASARWQKSYRLPR